MFKHSVFAAWCEGQQGSPCTLNNLKVAVGEPVWFKTSDDLESIPSLLDEAYHQSCMGLVVLVYVPYEAAPAFDSALSVSETGCATTTVMGFGPEQVLSWADFLRDQPSAYETKTAKVAWTPWLNEQSQQWFDESFVQVKEWIESGDFYQINLTTRLRATLSTKADEEQPVHFALFKLFLKLFEAQPAAFSMFLRLPEQPTKCSDEQLNKQSTEQTILSLSPELFFTWDKGRIVTSPMKGTRKPDDKSPRLADSSKDRAENLMIVDLLRNDLARVCLPRTVQAESLFDVMTLPSVEQMTSTISGVTRPDIQVSDMFGALFPCGSVTGAPKAQSMKRIAQLEQHPRGAYCGALGLMRADGSMRFSVPIRTLTVSGAGKSNSHSTVEPETDYFQRLYFEYGVGSGLTWYSNKQDEHKEWWQKTVFLREETVDFDILETVRLDNRAWQNMELHLQRMRSSARYFSYVWNETQIRSQLEKITQDAQPDAFAFKGGQTADPGAVYRGRWLLSAEGDFSIQLFPLQNPTSEKVRLMLADRPIEDALLDKGIEFSNLKPFIHHKTTYRPHYEVFSLKVDASSTHFDTLLYNREGYLTESCRFNLVLKIGTLYKTPMISEENGINNGVNLLNGVLRQRLLSENRIQEYPLHIGDLAQAEEVWLINSLRGWVRVDEIVSQSFDQQGAVIFPQRHS